MYMYDLVYINMFKEVVFACVQLFINLYNFNSNSMTNVKHEIKFIRISQFEESLNLPKIF